jgi:tetratricopeptide (TPR) repeat protein
MSNRRIFVSATNRDLASYRDLASKSLRKRGYDVDDEAVFNLSFLELNEMLKQRIERCDAVVCLVGFAYGGEPSNRPPDQPRRSYTQWEFHLARQLDKAVYLLMAQENTTFDEPKPNITPESGDLLQLQRDHRVEITRDRDWRPFSSTDQLRAELAELHFPWPDSPVPHQPNNLPLASIGKLFKGRDSFLDDLRQRLGVSGAPAPAIVNRLAVHGLGGVGKTRAAVEYAWRHAADYTALFFVSAPSLAELRSNLANLVGVLGMSGGETSVENQLAAVLEWLDAHPGWLLIIDNVDTEEAAGAVEDLLTKLRSGHILITSRIGNWGAGVEPLDLDVLAPPDAVAFLIERTPHRRKTKDEEASAIALARELDGLALMLEQAGANIDKLRLSFAEYLDQWKAKRPEVLRWHDQRLMKYPASVAVTWETTFAQLTDPERRLLDVLSWLAPDPIPRFLFDAKPLVDAIPEVRTALAALSGYSLARFDASGNAVLVHRLVQEITRDRIPAANRTDTLQLALAAVNVVAAGDSGDVRTWPIWQPLAAHGEAVSRYADAAGLANPTGWLLDQLGRYWLNRGVYREAEPLMRRAMSIDEASYGPAHPIVATRLNNLATLLQATSRLFEAEPLMRRVLSIRETSHGPGHPEVTTALNNLAQLLQDTNRLSEAEPLMRRALSIDEASHGAEHPNVAIDLNNLALLLHATNRLAEAEPLMRRALSIDESSYGPDHPSVARDLNNLAQLLQDANRLSEAEPLMRRALSIDEASYGPNHPNVAIDLNNLAQLLRATNRLSEAEPLMRRALSIDEASYGPDHPAVARDLDNLAQLLQDTDQLSEAEPLIRRALSIDEASYGPDHPDVAIVLNNLALLLRATNRLSEAEPLYRRAALILTDFTQKTRHEHPELQVVINNYRALLEAQGKTPEQIDQALSLLRNRE